jgi:putative ABC transport system substrate-binding protein
VAPRRGAAGPWEAANLRRIGFLTTTSAGSAAVAGFRGEIRRLGHVEGQTVRIEGRFAAGRLDRLPAMAAELAATEPDLMAVIGAVTVRAVRRASATIPLVFAVVLDPVADGLVPDAARPGGNTTGVTTFDPAQPRAQMRLLKEIVPGLERVAILGDAGVPDLLDRAHREAALAEGLRPQNVRLRGPGEDVDGVFAAMREGRAGAVLGLPVPAVATLGPGLIALATAARIPTMVQADGMPPGPLVAFGSGLAAAAARMAGMVDRVLRGARPGDLPVDAVTERRMVLDLRVARAIGVTIPPEVLARASRVIE